LIEGSLISTGSGLLRELKLTPPWVFAHPGSLNSIGSCWKLNDEGVIAVDKEKIIKENKITIEDVLSANGYREKDMDFWGHVEYISQWENEETNEAIQLHYFKE